MLALALLVGCGKVQPVPDLYVDGIGVRDETGGRFISDPDFEQRFRNTVRASAEYAGGSPGALAGWVVVFVDGDGVSCDAPDHFSTYLGCADWDNEVIRVVALGPGPCLEYTELPHEVVHAVIRDACHRNRLWEGFKPVQVDLEARQRDYRESRVCPAQAVLWQTPPTC